LKAAFGLDVVIKLENVLYLLGNTPLPMPKTSATPQTFKQSPADKQRLAKAAKALGETKSLVIRAALDQFLSDLEKQNLLPLN